VNKVAEFNRAGVPSIVMSLEMEDKVGTMKVHAMCYTWTISECLAVVLPQLKLMFLRNLA
jgi:hypothetical protein